MAKSFVKIYDTITIGPKSIDTLRISRDNFLTASGTPRSLRLDIVATHAARPTRNNGFYLPQKMREGAMSMVEPYNKPVLAHHDAHESPLGRIITAKYIDTSNTLPQNAARDSWIRGLNDAKTSFFRYVDYVDQMMDSDLIRDPRYPGLGHILATVELTDSDAIQKAIDKRFLTVSTGATSDKAVCSICKKDWIEEGFCDHVPGHEYDGKVALLIAGNLIYDELSFVNVPADVLARIVTVHNGTVTDSIEVKERDFFEDTSSKFYFGSGGTQMADQVNDTNTPAPAPTPANPPVPENPPAPAAVVADSTTPPPPPAPELPEEDRHYEDMIAFGWTLSLFDTGFEDEKLSAEQRKAMKTSTFCKPGERKYPVPDCNHARVAMAYAKKNNESSAVVSCIRRKAKALGCPFDEAEIDEILRDEAERAGKTTPAPTPAPAQETTAPAAECGCDELRKELESTKDKLQSAQNELKDLHSEHDRTLESHVSELAQVKSLLADSLVKLEKISGKNINLEDAAREVAAMPMVDLVKRVDGLKDSLKMDNVLKKLNDGMANNPEGTVENPTLADSQAQTNLSADDSTDGFKVYRDTFKSIVAKEGTKKADEYVRKLKWARLVPASFNPNK